MHMKVSLEDYEVGQMFQLTGDERIFKCFEYEGFKFYGYAFIKTAMDFMLDHPEAKRLAKNAGICIVSSRIIHIPKDNIFMNTALRKSCNFWSKEGIRYIAEARLEYKGIDYYRNSSAGADNVSTFFVTYCPEIACKRAVIQGIIDILDLKDVTVEYQPERTFIEKEESEDQDEKKDEKMMDETQLNMIKTLLKENDKRFSKKKYEKLTYEEAGNTIKELKKGVKNEKK